MEELDIFGGEPVRLLPLDQVHVPAIVGWFRTDPDVLRFLEWRSAIMADTEEEAWVRGVQASPFDYVFAVLEASTGRHIGTTGIHEIDAVERSGELGIYLAPTGRGRGYGRAAMRKLLTWAFDVMNLHRLSLRVWSFNEQAKRCYRAVGFVHEGTLREAHFFQGRYWDVEVYGILAEEFRSRGRGTEAATDG